MNQKTTHQKPPEEPRAEELKETLKEELKKISKDELALLPVRRYEGPICLVSSPNDLDRAREEFRSEHVVGLDTETQPTFRVGQMHLPSLVQVASSRTVYLFPLKRIDCVDVLTELLESTAVVKSGIGLDHDFLKLKMRFPFAEQNVVELTPAARAQGLGQTGVRNLAGMFLGFRISKGQKTSNWGQSHLTENQILYAATDAWVCRELYLYFHKEGFLKSIRN